MRYKKSAIIIGNYELLKSQLKILKIKRKIKIQKTEDIKKNDKVLNVLDVPLKFKKPFNCKSKRKFKICKKMFGLVSHKLCLQKKIKGIINCPINKKNLFKKKNWCN